MKFATENEFRLSEICTSSYESATSKSDTYKGRISLPVNLERCLFKILTFL